MAKLVSIIHDRVNLAIKKGLTGYFSPEQIDNEVNSEIFNLWRKYVVEFEKTRIINVYLNPFINPELATPNGATGIVTLTDAWHYPVAVRVVATGKTVTEVDQARWDRLINHPIEAPTTDYPICKFEAKKLFARPVNIGQLEINFIKKPTRSKWAYTIVSNRYVYDDTNSVDVEFDEILHDDIANRVLGNLGIPMREEFMVRVSEQAKATEGK